MFAKVETMKKECMELFKSEIIAGEIGIFECHTYKEIFTMRNVTIEKAAEEICEILNHIDECEYESNHIAMTFKEPNKEDIMEFLILHEIENLMKNTDYYNKDDSRTELYARIIECVEFMQKNEFIQEMIISHTESFLFDEQFDITIYDVCKYGSFSIKVMNNIYDISNINDSTIWNEIWNEVYRIVGC